MITNPYDRYGSQNTSVPISLVSNYTVNGVNVSGYPANHTGQMSRIVREFRGVTTPHFHARKRRGELIPQTFWLRYESVAEGDGEYFLTWRNLPSQNIQHQDEVPSWRFTDLSVVAKTLEQLETSLDFDYTLVQSSASKIYSSGFDALTFVAELADIRKLLTSGIKRLLSLKLPNNWKQIANDWLEWRYGWRQILFDIRNIEELIDNFNNKRTRYSEHVGYQYTDTTTNSSDYDWGMLVSNTLLTNKITVSCRGSVVADIDIPKLSLNPFVTAWEVIPLSFVVDWFVTVGRTISALSFLVFNSNYTASCGSKVTSDYTYEISLKNVDAGVSSATVSLVGHSVNTLEVRLPSSVPYFPRFTMNLNTFKILDLLGLMIQRFK